MLLFLIVLYISYRFLHITMIIRLCLYPPKTVCLQPKLFFINADRTMLPDIATKNKQKLTKTKKLYKNPK